MQCQLWPLWYASDFDTQFEKSPSHLSPQSHSNNPKSLSRYILPNQSVHTSIYNGITRDPKKRVHKKQFSGYLYIFVGSPRLNNVSSHAYIERIIIRTRARKVKCKHHTSGGGIIPQESWERYPAPTTPSSASNISLPTGPAACHYEIVFAPSRSLSALLPPEWGRGVESLGDEKIRSFPFFFSCVFFFLTVVRSTCHAEQTWTEFSFFLAFPGWVALCDPWFFRVAFYGLFRVFVTFGAVHLHYVMNFLLQNVRIFLKTSGLMNSRWYNDSDELFRFIEKKKKKRKKLFLI